MKIAAFGPLLTSTYTDNMDIYRHTQVTNADGTIGIGIPATPVHSKVKCRLSFESRDYPKSDLEDTNPINLQLKIFCGPYTDIKKGDRLVANRIDENGNVMKSYQGTANLPFIFATHQEVEVVESGDA